LRFLPVSKRGRAGRDPQGTGFLIARPSKLYPEKQIVLAVSNHHVVCGETGASVIRLMKLDGTPDPIALGPEDWFYDPAGPDVMIAPIDIDLNVHRYRFIPIDGPVEPNPGLNPIGLGDDVFMVGCFIDPDVRGIDRPTVRFGNISMMPAPLKQPNGNTLPAYCLDMHSRSGYSGSPVFVYRTPGSDLSPHDGGPHQVLAGGTHFVLCLGIHIGQFNEYWPIRERKFERRSAEANQLEASEQVVKGVSGMTAVVPFADVLKLLEMPKLKKAIQKREGADRTSTAAQPSLTRSRQPTASPRT
jgi:hypothetical protein